MQFFFYKNKKNTHTAYMPSFYTHYAVARDHLHTLPLDVQIELRPFLSLYFFGAQGADFCFFYRALRSLTSQTQNFGSYLHRHGGRTVFRIMQTLSLHNQRLLAYSLGYLTHYAADCTFHPFVYAMAGKSHVQHSRIENILDGYFKSKPSPFLKNFIHNTSTPDPFFRHFGNIPTKDDQSDLFFLFSTIATKLGFPTLEKKAFTRAISLFNAYMGVPSTQFYKSKTLREKTLNREKRTWYYPADPTIASNDNANELYEKSVHFANTLSREFLFCLQNKTPLPTALFNNSLLTGLPLA